MKNKYENTLFENEYAIPSKKENSKSFFFRFPLKEIGYISFNNLFLLIIYYTVTFLFFSFLYDKHVVTAVIALILLVLNVLFGIILVFREGGTGKNSLDMVFIIYRYLKKKNIGIFKGKKRDAFSRNQL